MVKAATNVMLQCNFEIFVIGLTIFFSFIVSPIGVFQR